MVFILNDREKYQLYKKKLYKIAFIKTKRCTFAQLYVLTISTIYLKINSKYIKTILL